MGAWAIGRRGVIPLNEVDFTAEDALRRVSLAQDRREGR